jgi:hypothetical protein
MFSTHIAASAMGSPYESTTRPETRTVPGRTSSSDVSARRPGAFTGSRTTDNSALVARCSKTLAAAKTGVRAPTSSQKTRRAGPRELTYVRRLRSRKVLRNFRREPTNALNGRRTIAREASARPGRIERIP